MAIPFLNNINLSDNELQNAKLQITGTAPTSATGQIYYDSSLNVARYYDNNGWLRITDSSVASGTFVSSTLSGTNSEPIFTVELSATGTPSSSTFLRGDNTFATPVSGSNILEVVTGACDGRTVSTSNGNITLSDITAEQQLTTSFADVTGSSIAYTPPSGTTHLKYSFQFFKTIGSGSALTNTSIYVDGTEVENSRQNASGGADKINVEYIPK